MLAPSRLSWLRLSVGILVGLLGTEAGLRFFFETLPSLSEKTLAPSSGMPCEPAIDSPPPAPAWSQSFNSEGLGSIHILVSGDSMALGTSVPTKQSFPWLLGERLAEEENLQVTVTNLSINSGTGCDTVGRLLSYLRHQTADVVLSVFFSDDLQLYKGIAQQGSLYLDPQHIDGLPAKALLSHSYTANWLWWTLLRTSNPGTDAPLTLEKTKLKQGLQALTEQTSRLEIQSLTTLLAPAGAPLCDDLRPESRPLQECAQLQQGGNALHDLLAPNTVELLDLRDLWKPSPSPFLAEEHDAMTETQRLPVHPNPSGHKQIANRLWPELQRAVSQSSTPH